MDLPLCHCIGLWCAVLCAPVSVFGSVSVCSNESQPKMSRARKWKWENTGKTLQQNLPVRVDASWIEKKDSEIFSNSIHLIVRSEPKWQCSSVIWWSLFSVDLKISKAEESMWIHCEDKRNGWGGGSQGTICIMYDCLCLCVFRLVFWAATIPTVCVCIWTRDRWKCGAEFWERRWDRHRHHCGDLKSKCAKQRRTLNFNDSEIAQLQTQNFKWETECSFRCFAF